MMTLKINVEISGKKSPLFLQTGTVASIMKAIIVLFILPVLVMTLKEIDMCYLDTYHARDTHRQTHTRTRITGLQQMRPRPAFSMGVR